MNLICSQKNGRSQGLSGPRPSHAHPELDAVVGREDEGATKAAHKLGEYALVHSGEALGLHHLEKAIDAAAVEALFSWLLGVEHHAPADGVEGVVEWRRDCACHGGGDE